MRKTLIFFAAITGVSVAFRIYMIANFTEPQTGFYTRDAGLLPSIFNLIMAVAVILCVVEGRRYGRRLRVSGPVTPAGDSTAATLLFVLAAAVLLSAVQSLISLRLTMSPRQMVETAVAGIAAVVLFSAGLSSKKEEANERVYTRMLAVTVWFLVNLITTFLGFSTIATISEHIVEVLMLASVMLFSFYDVKGKSVFCGSGRIVAFGLMSVYFVCLSVMPRIFFALYPRRLYVYTGQFGLTAMVYVVMLAYTVFTLVTLESTVEDQILRGILLGDESDEGDAGEGETEAGEDAQKEFE